MSRFRDRKETAPCLHQPCYHNHDNHQALGVREVEAEAEPIIPRPCIHTANMTMSHMPFGKQSRSNPWTSVIRHHSQA